jgi:hypothetical protein
MLSGGRWTVCVYGGTCPNLIRYRLDEEPEDREVEDLLAKHGATIVSVAPPHRPQETTR